MDLYLEKGNILSYNERDYPRSTYPVHVEKMSLPWAAYLSAAHWHAREQFALREQNRSRGADADLASAAVFTNLTEGVPPFHGDSEPPFVIATPRPHTNISCVEIV